MSRVLLAIIVCATLGLATADTTFAAKKAVAKAINKKCPVHAENEVDAKVTYKHEKKLVGFCSRACIKEFRKDPAKYMAVIAQNEPESAETEETETADATTKKDDKKSDKVMNDRCPVHPDRAVDPLVTSEVKGYKIGFCCEDCQKKFMANPEPFLKNLKKSGKGK